MTLFRIRKIEEDGSTACYEIGPLLPGYGVTLGHPLQKALLTLPGAAVTAMRIEGIQDESQEIAGVDEDVTDLMLNIKHLRLRCQTILPVTLYLNAHGTGEVTAEEIVCPESVEIVNREIHIATLNHAQARLALALTVTQGKGYVPAPKPSPTSAGSILLDALYTPVIRMSYRIERARVGNVTPCRGCFVFVTCSNVLAFFNHAPYR